MSDIAIRVENLGKRYRIGHLRERHNTLRDALVAKLTSWKVRRGERSNLATFQPANRSDDYIWALKDVSFEIKRGEVVGVIGRNGAGKSTLLKILSRITEPTEGFAEIHGRLGALLEVGTGFHPELTGRENIFLSGAIMGMKRAEIARKFDEIVAFAEVEKFIDTPVKRYSSGMYVRLAFAVAAHLEPEILLVDEVLAVGDAAFQKKCLGKISDVANEGRTVLFVSHNMAAIGRLCPRTLWIDQGQLANFNESGAVMSAYLASTHSVSSQRSWPDRKTAPGDEFIRAVSVSLLDANHQLTTMLHQDRPFLVSIVYHVYKPMMNANVGFELRTEEGTTIFSSFDADNPAWSGVGRKPGFYRAECLIPAHLLNQGSYYLTLSAGIPHLRLCFKAEDVLRLDVSLPLTGAGPTGRMGTRRPGLLAPELEWNVTEDDGGLNS